MTVANYFEALALNYLEDTLKSYPLLRFIRLTITQKRCASRVLFNHIYTNTKSTAELIDLFQNISTAVAIIKQVTYLLFYILQLPPIFDKLLQNFIKFRFSDTCLDVFTSNYLCPVCRNQPFMCPGRCAEIVTGCVSPLNQAIVQLDTSINLVLCMLILYACCEII